MSFIQLVLTIFVISCVVVKGTTIHDEGFATALPRNWDYDYSQVECPTTCSVETKCGPHCWDYVGGTSCSLKSQTPINLVQSETNPKIKYPKFHSGKGCDNWTQFANDHAFEVSFSEVGNVCEDNYLYYENQKHLLLQMHFHTPSEHTIGGGHAAAELHLVHKNVVTGGLLVLGILINEVTSDGKVDSQGNDFFKHFLDIAEAKHDAHKRPDTIYSHEYKVTDAPSLKVYDEILPASREFYTYKGSLTTPPCSENVRWIVFAEDVKLSSVDLQKLKQSVAEYPYTQTFKKFGYSSNRPVQELNDREVYRYQG